MAKLLFKSTIRRTPKHQTSRPEKRLGTERYTAARHKTKKITGGGKSRAGKSRAGNEMRPNPSHNCDPGRMRSKSLWRKRSNVLPSRGLPVLHSSQLYVLHSSQLYVLHSSQLCVLHSSQLCNRRLDALGNRSKIRRLKYSARTFTYPM